MFLHCCLCLHSYVSTNTKKPKEALKITTNFHIVIENPNDLVLLSVSQGAAGRHQAGEAHGEEAKGGHSASGGRAAQRGAAQGPGQRVFPVYFTWCAALGGIFSVCYLHLTTDCRH